MRGSPLKNPLSTTDHAGCYDLFRQPLRGIKEWESEMGEGETFGDLLRRFRTRAGFAQQVGGQLSFEPLPSGGTLARLRLGRGSTPTLEVA